MPDMFETLPTHDAASSHDVTSTAPDNGATLPSRRRLLGTALIGGVALAVGAAGMRPANADLIDTLDRFLDLDPIVINFAFELEELQADFFERATLSSGYSRMSERERNTFNLIAMQDRQQYNELGKLRERLGVKGGDTFEYPNASASRRPSRFNFPDVFDDRVKLLNEAVKIKELAVKSYHGAVRHIDRSNLTLAAAIAGTDGRHLAVLRELAGMDPVPSSFEMPVSPQITGRKLGKYGFKGGGLR